MLLMELVTPAPLPTSGLMSMGMAQHPCKLTAPLPWSLLHFLLLSPSEH